jgi:solute carrier family 13 (sodium-dependent dicarboxylate transporter), member 2/3/5
MSWVARIGLVVGPLLAAAIALLVHRTGLGSDAVWTAGVAMLCAVWWMTEPIPIPVTSLLPIAIFPMVGVLTARDVGAAYGDPMILLLMGGAMLSTALEKSGAHRRLALGMVNFIGARSSFRLILGFMVAGAALSMWISNAATTLMMLPIAIAAVEKVNDKRLAAAVLLGVAYAASIGGIGTPVGTPPNLIFMKEYTVATGKEISFLTFMSWTLPIVVVMTPLAAWVLSRGLPKKLSLDLAPTGPWRPEEIRTFAGFAITALLWVTRAEPWGGWSTWLGLPNATDASVALLAVVAMCLLPNGRGGKLLDWKAAEGIPWGVLILFSGGLVIADAFEKSKLSLLIAESVSGLTALPPLALIGLVCVTVIFLTEFTSNTALATLLMPIMAAAAKGANIDPLTLMAPAAIAASYGFMMPVGTAPNAIVFGSGRVTVGQMARHGLAINLLGAVVITVCFWLYSQH